MIKEKIIKDGKEIFCRIFFFWFWTIALNVAKMNREEAKRRTEYELLFPEKVEKEKRRIENMKIE